MKRNLNQISRILKLEKLAEDGVMDQDANQAVQYFTRYKDLFRKHGITEHLKARELEQMTAPAEQVFTEAEYPPTMAEMKSLEVDIGKLEEA